MKIGSGSNRKGSETTGFQRQTGSSEIGTPYGETGSGRHSTTNRGREKQMTNLPASWVQPSVPMDRPRPAKAWLTARILSLWSHYQKREEPEQILMMRLADWVSALETFPQEAIDKGCSNYVRHSKWAPALCEIISETKAHIVRPKLQAVPDPYAPDENFEPISLDRARQIAEETDMEDNPVVQAMLNRVAQND